MLFNSIEFLIFFLIVFLVYFSLPYRFRVGFLLVASYYFYMRWKWEYATLIFGQTLVNYYCGYRMGQTDSLRAKRSWLLAGLIVSLGTLFFFKYYNFANDTLGTIITAMGMQYLVPHLQIILPVGISFFTFQTLSYTIDVYRGQCRVEKNFPRFALFVSFFPQLVAGPIERATHLLDQFKRNNRFCMERTLSGCKLIAWGLFKKVVIADRLALYVDMVYANPEGFSGNSLLLASYFFAFQIYCDFSGYSDMAIGLARILGYDLMQNFKLPYFATSISDFWQRWHISLSTWFRDYVYIPLGGNRVGPRRHLVNLGITFVISGLWHGANWTFAIWGGLHALYYLIERILRGVAVKQFRGRRPPRWLTTPALIVLNFHLVLVAWIFFRAGSLEDALLIVNRVLFDRAGTLYPGPSQLTTYLSVVLVLALLVVQVLQRLEIASLYFSRSKISRPIRWAGYLAMLLATCLFAKGTSDFIYFQF